MAQLRQGYEALTKLDGEVMVVGPDKPGAFAAFWKKHDLPFIGLPDPTHSVLKLYGQEIRLFKLGRMPAQALVDREGVARFVHYGHSMSDIPPTDEIVDLLREFNGIPGS